MRPSIATGFVTILGIATFGCGQKLGSIEQTGTVQAVVSVNTAQLDGYFLLECCKNAFIAQGDAAPADADVQACANKPTRDMTTCSQTGTAGFLSVVSKLGGNL